jgi:hypothetical protein
MVEISIAREELAATFFRAKGRKYNVYSGV